MKKYWIIAGIVLMLIALGVGVGVNSHSNQKEKGRVELPAVTPSSQASMATHSTSDVALFNRGLRLVNTTNWREGEKLMEQVVAHPAAGAELKVRACQVIIDINGSAPDGDPAKGKKYARIALKLQADHPDEVSEETKSTTDILFGMVLQTNHQYKESAERERKALKTEPKNVRAAYYLGKALISQGKIDEGVRVYEELKQRYKTGEIINTPDNFTPDDDVLEICVWLAHGYLLKKQPVRARQNLNEAVQILEALPQKTTKIQYRLKLHRVSYNHIGWTFLKLGDLQKAKGCFEQAIRMGYNEGPNWPQEGLRRIERYPNL